MTTTPLRFGQAKKICLQTVAVLHIDVDKRADEEHKKHDDIHETVTFFTSIFEM